MNQKNKEMVELIDLFTSFGFILLFLFPFPVLLSLSSLSPLSLSFSLWTVLRYLLGFEDGCERFVEGSGTRNLDSFCV